MSESDLGFQELPRKLPCLFDDRGAEEWQTLGETLTKEEARLAIRQGFPWYSIDHGPIVRAGYYIEWNIPDPEGFNAEIDTSDLEEGPYTTPLGLRIYGQLKIASEAPQSKFAASYFNITAVREISRQYRLGAVFRDASPEELSAPRWGSLESASSSGWDVATVDWAAAPATADAPLAQAGWEPDFSPGDATEGEASGLSDAPISAADPYEVPRAAGPHVQLPESSPQPLFWNTRFPERPDILANDPHVLESGRDYLLNTRLEAIATSDGASRPQDARRLLGRKIRFRFEVLETLETLQDGAESGVRLRLRLPGDEVWQIFALSPEFSCTDSGTPAFGVELKAENAGLARLRAHLLVDGGSVDEFILDFEVQDQSSAARSRRSPVKSMPGRPSRHTVLHAPSPEFALTLGSTVLQFSHRNTMLAMEPFPAQLAEQLNELARARRPTLETLSRNAAPNPNVDRPFRLQRADESLLQLARVGAEFHDRLFRHAVVPSQIPKSFRDKLATVADRLQNEGSSQSPTLIQIVSDLPVPWGLLYDRSGGKDIQSVDDIEPDGFWGRRFDIFRSVESVDREPYRGTRRWVTPLIGSQVPRHEDHHKVIEDIRLRGDGDQLKVHETLTTKEDLFGWTSERNDSDLLYFFCHSVPAGLAGPGEHQAPESWLGLGASDGEERVGLRQLKSRWREPRETNPIVILNACSSGQEQPVFGSPFRDFFVTTWKAQIFIGTDWPVNAVFADKFGEALLDALLIRRMSVRDALRQVGDNAARDNNFFSLMYAVYGDNSVRFEEPILDSDGGP